MADGINFGPSYNQKRVPIAAPFRWLSGALRGGIDIDPDTGQAAVSNPVRDAIFNLGRGRARASEFNAAQIMAEREAAQRAAELQAAQEADFRVNEMIQKYGLKQAVRPERIRQRGETNRQMIRGDQALDQRSLETQLGLQDTLNAAGVPADQMSPEMWQKRAMAYAQAPQIQNLQNIASGHAINAGADLSRAQGATAGRQPIMPIGDKSVYDPNSGKGVTVDMHGQPQTWISPNMDAYHKRLAESQASAGQGGSVGGQLGENQSKGNMRKVIGAVGNALSTYGVEDPDEKQRKLEAIQRAGQVLAPSPFGAMYRAPQ